MEEYNIFYGCLDKIETLCRENDLTVDLTSTSYPFTIIVRSYRPMYEQVAIPETEDRVIQGGTISMKYIDGELVISQSGYLEITGALQDKIKKLFTNLYRAYTQYFFRDAMERGLQPSAVAGSNRTASGAAREADPASFLREAMMIPRIDCTAGGGPMPVSS